MKKNVLTFGLIAGCIVTMMMLITAVYCQGASESVNMYLGYGTQLIAFSMIFVAVKNYRDKYNNGVITFGKAFTIGLYITLIAATMYVVAWLFDYHFFMPDFMDKYAASMIAKAKSSGKSQQEIKEQIVSATNLKQMYKNPVFLILITYAEILPVGLLIALISALILKKKISDNNLAVS
ncbi:DUF4199 domain-containing protein [Mucilaginibacter flavus]|uniref:DUF4199 domain-containing protein n=1 Tax=Mucilaginibacter flavus TaxID=931504 RepID=UPI0025B36A5D|nr:DUF4199 domain-containing protein [Mucilaginibacter flavus]MDN3579761.1 DUF4199 domain-containing protein [Mucilaginibacter flavus]